MSSIHVCLLGTTQTEIDSQAISLPFKQAEALWYYLLTEKETSRDKIAGIIWGGGCDEGKVKSSMRNAIYVIRKAFGRDCIIEPRKDILQMNPACNLQLDISHLFENIPSVVSYYKGDFLENFYLKDNELFNDWIQTTQQQYKLLYQEQLHRYIEDRFQKDNMADCEDACMRLISLDEFDEYGYRRLIEIYKTRNEYSKAIRLYNKLEKLLSDELFQSPDEDIVSMMESIKQERNHEVLELIAQKGSLIPAAAESKKTSLFYGRRQEQSLLLSGLVTFLSGNPASSSLAVVGEAGVGKTCLLRKVLHDLDMSGILLCQTSCYREEESYSFKPWHHIFQQILSHINDTRFNAAASRLSPFLFEKNDAVLDQDEIATENYDNSQRNLTLSLLHIAEKQRMIIFIDDIQWADPASVSLIRDLMTTGKNENILFLLGCRNDHHTYIDNFLEELRAADVLHTILLERFDYDDTVQLATLLLPDRFSSEVTKRQLYHETEGNPFFIIETVNNIKYNGGMTDITPNMKDTIRLRICHLTLPCRTILDLLSLFFDGASFDVLSELSGKEEYELLDILDTLMHNRLIREELLSDGIVFQFTHHKISEYVYSELSMTKRQILHGKIASCLENKLTHTLSDVPLYSKLSYHFRLSGNRKKFLQYNIEYVYSHLNRSHEYYPVLTTGLTLPPYILAGSVDIASADSESVYQILQEIAKLVQELQNEFSKTDCQTFLSDFYHMIGRYYIRNVNYKKGLEFIMRLTELNGTLDSERAAVNMIKANRQLMCVYINRYEPAKMKSVIEQSFHILTGNAKQEEIAIWMRLNGLYHIMSGEYDKGTDILNTAFSIFDKSPEKEKYLFNQAASCAWLGEAKRIQGDYSAAMEYYDRAISICESHFLTGGIATFYTYAGQAALDSGDYKSAERYLTEAVKQYNQVELMWGRGMAMMHLALLHLHKKHYPKTLLLLTQAESCSNKLESPLELGVLNRIYTQLALQLKKTTSAKFRDTFRDFLQDEPEVYYHRARTYLKDIYTAPTDQRIMEQLGKQLLGN